MATAAVRRGIHPQCQAYLRHVFCDHSFHPECATVISAPVFSRCRTLFADISHRDRRRCAHLLASKSPWIVAALRYWRIVDWKRTKWMVQAVGCSCASTLDPSQVDRFPLRMRHAPIPLAHRRPGTICLYNFGEGNLHHTTPNYSSVGRRSSSKSYSPVRLFRSSNSGNHRSVRWSNSTLTVPNVGHRQIHPGYCNMNRKTFHNRNNRPRRRSTDNPNNHRRFYLDASEICTSTLFHRWHPGNQPRNRTNFLRRCIDLYQGTALRPFCRNYVEPMRSLSPIRWRMRRKLCPHLEMEGNQ